MLGYLGTRVPGHAGTLVPGTVFLTLLGSQCVPGRAYPGTRNCWISVMLILASNRVELTAGFEIGKDDKPMHGTIVSNTPVPG